MEILVVDLFDTVDLVCASDGDKIHAAICTALETSDQVHVNYGGVGVFPSYVMNHIIGDLLCRYSRVELRERLHFKGLDSNQDATMRAVIDNAINFHRERVNACW